MKFNFSKEWCEVVAREEQGLEISAGVIAGHPVRSDDEQTLVGQDESRVALGKFLHLNRRRLRWTYEELSERADVDIAELMYLESDASYVPDVRTVYKLAVLFEVDQRKLMGLSGLTKPKDRGYVDDAVRYAARSESLEELSPEELAALDGLISVLSAK